MVSLGGVEFRTKREGLQDVLPGICKHQRLSLTLVDLEVGVQKASHVQVGRQLPFTGAHHHQEPSRWHRGACRNFKFVHVAEVVRKEIPSQVDVRRSGVEEFHKVFVVAPHPKGVVAARKFVDDDLGRGAEGQDPPDQQTRASLHPVSSAHGQWFVSQCSLAVHFTSNLTTTDACSFTRRRT